jgi:hypothetical protein
MENTQPPIKKKRGLEKGSEQAKEWAKKMADARKAKSIKTKSTEPKVKIEMMGEPELILPEYFAVRRKNGFKLVNPMTKERNLSKRGGQTSVRVLRKPVADAILLEGESDLIPLSLFSRKDRELITAKFDKIEQNKEIPISQKPVIQMPPAKERGRPERLPKNIEINKERNQGVAKKGRPAKYKSQEEAKKARAIKDKERYAKKQEAKKQVAGTGSMPLDIIRCNSSSISDLSQGSNGSGVAKKIKDIKDRVSSVAKEVYYGATSLPLQIQKLLQRYGNEEIVSLKIMRTPVPKVLSGVLTLFSGGKFGDRMKENNFDTLFHLFIEATLRSGTKIQLEKNERITMLLNPKSRPKTEVEPITAIPSGLTLNKLLENTKNKMGSSFLSYSAKDNNCQDFLASVLTSNNLGTPEDMSFVKQDTQTLFEDLPYLRKFANTLTDIGAKASAIVSGGRINRKGLTKNNISSNDITMPVFKDTRFRPPTDSVIPQSRFGSMVGRGMINREQLARLNGEDTTGRIYTQDMVENPYGDKPVRRVFTGQGRKMKGMGNPLDFFDTSGLMSGYGMKGKGNAFGFADAGDYFSKMNGKGVRGKGRKMKGCSACPMCSGSGMCGSGFFDDVGNAFRSVGDTIKGGFEENIIKPAEQTFTPELGKQIASTLIHEALPAVISGIASSGTTALTGNPALGFAVGQTAGKVAGKKAGDALGDATGYGLKKPNDWITLVKKVQKEKGVSYKEAMTIASKMRK